MNLPAELFLADLPPEATLSPAMIAEACQTLKRNREHYLLNRVRRKIGESFERRGDGWLQPDNPFASSRWSLGRPKPVFRATLARGLDNFSGNSRVKIFTRCFAGIRRRKRLDK
jgi:hypothetical protein